MGKLSDSGAWRMHAEATTNMVGAADGRDVHP